MLTKAEVEAHRNRVCAFAEGCIRHTLIDTALSLFARAEAAETQVARLRAALEPFAEIQPSSFYSADGSEAEEYVVVLKDYYANPTAFTGSDLARARATLGET